MKSNEVLLTMRQNLISAYKKSERFVLPILKFILCLSTLRILKEVTRYDGALGSIFILMGIAFIGAFASAQTIQLMAILLSVIFILPTNPIFAVVLFVTLMMLYILFGRLFPKESILIIVMLVAFSINMEIGIPIIAALFGSYASIIAIVIASMLWYLLPELGTIFPPLPSDKGEMLEVFRDLVAVDFKALVMNKTMMVVCIVFLTVFTVVYIIRKLPIDYGPYIAIGIGATMNIIGFGLASIFFVDINVNIVLVLIETIIYCCVALVAQFLSIVLDYQSAEAVEFEDDDNYYYVKIVPKIKLDIAQKNAPKVYTNLSETNNYKKFFKDDEMNHNL